MNAIGTRPTDTPRGIPNCGIVSLAAALGTTHAAVWNTYAERYVKRPRSWRGRTNLFGLIDVAERLGGKVHAYLPPGASFKWRCTLATWVRDYARPGVTYIVRTTGHMQCVRDGRVTDQHADREPVAKLGWQARKHVTHVYAVALR